MAVVDPADIEEAAGGGGSSPNGNATADPSGQGLGEPVKQRLPSCLVSSTPPDINGVRRMIYNRRRPFHSGRFLAFARRHFGPLSFERLDDDASSCGWSEQQDAWSRFCRRRRRLQAGDVESASSRSAVVPDDGAVPLLQEGQAPRLGKWAIDSAGGCLWFAASDDRRVQWQFDAPRSGQPIPPRHHLRCGGAWPSSEVFEDKEAGRRCVEIEFILRPDPSMMRSSVDEMSTQADSNLKDMDDSDPLQTSFEQAQEILRSGLEACLLTRREASDLEVGEESVLASLQEWEAYRRSSELGPTQWSLALRSLVALTHMVSAIPGSQRMAAVGEALTRRVSTAMGAPDGPGHEVDEDQAPRRADDGC